MTKVNNEFFVNDDAKDIQAVSLDYIALRVVQTISAPYPVLQTFLTPMSIKFSPL